MSASLVGSEMCIRDSPLCRKSGLRHSDSRSGRRPQSRETASSDRNAFAAAQTAQAKVAV
eukprot:15252693-Alexandrium_andersonii.AAC.1